MNQNQKQFYTKNQLHTKAPLLKIVIIGDSGVGKTTLIQSFITNGKISEDFKQSVGIDFIVKKLEINNMTTVRFELWDTAGNEKFRTMISSYYKGAQGIILLFDSTSVKTFYSLKNWMKEIKQFANESAIKYLVSNKIDIQQHDSSVNSSSWSINEEEVEKFANANKMKYSRTSAMNHVNVHDLFCSIASDIINSLDEEKITLRNESIKLGYLNNGYFNNSERTESKLMSSNQGNNPNNSNSNQAYNQGSALCCKI